MRHILLFGWCLPSEATDGASLFLRKLAAKYRSEGDYVEIFTVARPEKWPPEERPEPWTLLRREYEGTFHNVLIRPWGLLHTDPLNPARSVREDTTRRIWLDFLDQGRKWDVVHFNDVSPLELIECTKRKLGCEIRFSFHNFYLLFPIEHLFSYRKYEKDPCGDLTIYDLSGEGAASEYASAGLLGDSGRSRESALARAFEERLQYGRYLLEEVIDEVWGSHLRFLLAIRNLFGIRLRRYRLFDPLVDRDFDLENAARTAAERIAAAPKVVFAELANIHLYKGQHILLRLCDRLRAYRGRFEIRLYGGVNDAAYMNRLREECQDGFIRDHVQFCGGYTQEDLDRIASEIHVHISCIPLLPYISGSILETHPRGVLPVYKEDILLKKRRESGERLDILSYDMGDVDRLFRIASDILDDKLDVERQFLDTAESIRSFEHMGVEYLAC